MLGNGKNFGQEMKMRINKFEWVLLLCSCLVSIVGCDGTNNPKFGLDYNEQRAELGLEEIPQHFCSCQEHQKFVPHCWRNPEFDPLDSTKFQLIYKHVNESEGELLYDGSFYEADLSRGKVILKHGAYFEDNMLDSMAYSIQLRDDLGNLVDENYLTAEQFRLCLDNVKFVSNVFER